MSITNLLQFLFNDTATAEIYTLTAKGLFIAHLATHKLNFGQGDFLMVGSFLTMGMLLAGYSAVLAVIAVLIAMGLLGYILERVAIRPLDRAAHQTAPTSCILTPPPIALLLQT